MTPELELHIKSISRLIYVVTAEEDRLLSQLQEMTDKKKKPPMVKVWNATMGLQPLSTVIGDWTKKAHPKHSETMSIHNALEEIYKDGSSNERAFYILLDPERYLVDPQVQRRMLNLLHQGNNNITTAKVIICISNTLKVPDKLARYTEVVHDTGLTGEQIEEIVGNTCENLSIESPEESEKIFKGLTGHEIKSSLIQTYKRTNSGWADPRLLSQYRFNQLKKTNLIRYVDTSNWSFDLVGGAGRLKEWSAKTAAAWTQAGQDFGLEPPKGVLAVGVWGTGKSISIKSLSNAWGLPMLQLDIGKLRQSGVGDSEANTYRVINIIENMAPCVTGDTEVTLADGTTTPIQELWEETPKDLRVVCWNDKLLKSETTQVTHITRREADVFRVEAHHGYSLKATDNHLHYAMRGGMPEWVRTDELVPGDMLAVITRVDDRTSDCTHAYPEGMRTCTRNGVAELRRGRGGFSDAVVPRLPTEWTSDLGWLLGMLEGDGYVGKRGTIGVVNTSEGILDNADRIRRELFGIESVRYETTSDASANLPGLSADPHFKRCWDSKVGNKLAAEFLTNARASVLSAPKQARAAFLAGWIDADGCIGGDKITLTVKGAKLNAERKLLARQIIQSLGVVPSKFDGVNLEITGTRAVKLASVLYEHLVLKRPKASLVTSSQVGFDRGMGFACGSVLSQARVESGLKHKDLPVSTSTTWGYETGKVAVSERHLENYARWLESSDLGMLLGADCRWVAITEISPLGEDVVYDLACEGEDTHSFIANGLITHNCLVWIDEAEKSLSGGSSSAHTDGGTGSRMIGALSTWHQETTAKVCLAMTANSLATLPVEFVNRMDERWFFDLPSLDDRQDILKIHLAKRGLNPEKYNLHKLGEAAKEMVGREIEQSIKAAWVESFHQNKKTLDEDLLIEDLKRRPRIVRTMQDEISEVTSWVGYDENVNDGVRARYAADPKGRNSKLSLG